MTALHALTGRGRYVIRPHASLFRKGWHVVDTEAKVLPILGNHLCPIKAWQHVKQLKGRGYGATT